MIDMPAPVVCVVPGDLHLTTAQAENCQNAKRLLREIDELIRPDFVQFIGDNVQDGTDEQFKLFLDLARRLTVPWHALVGDHDAQRDVAASRFRRWVGDPTGSDQIRGFRFLRLNSQEGNPTGFSEEQMSWFRREVDAGLISGQRIIVFQHNYPYKVCESFAGPGVEAWRQIVQSRCIAGIFTGHTHYGQIANDGRNLTVTTRSIGDPEGGAAGYLLIFLDGEDLAVRFRSVEDAGPVVLITHPRERLLMIDGRHVVRGPDELRARIWSRRPIASVQGQVDERDWQPLRQTGQLDWTMALAGERLHKGRHRMVVGAMDEGGGCDQHALDFWVDVTGRFTAVPGVWPVVEGTQFC